MMTIIYIISGLGLLILGAELLVRGASQLAATLGLSPLIIGLTVVALGTSAPEMAISLKSALSGQPDIALGNVIGSNIFNVLFILGLSASLRSLVVSSRLIRLDVPIMAGVSFLLYVLCWNGDLSRIEGLFLCLLGAVYLMFGIRASRSETKAVKDEYCREYGPTQRPYSQRLLLLIVYIIAGLVLLVLGSRWLIDGAVVLSRWIGLSELIIGLTLIAAGTSLPEVAASVIAVWRGERDIAAGNVVGSNISNILFILGLTALFSPGGIPVNQAALSFDIPVMMAAAVACLPIFFTGYSIARWEGWIFLGYYMAYTTYLILDASQHDALPIFSAILMLFILPLTAFTIILVAYRSFHKNRRSSP